ncbi:hypothetical protein VTK56DRAFT_5605 [Thermocarpiscus australiensis]
MAHLPANTAIFSPSVARAAASAAKDWSYVDAWLHRKFPGRGPPPFERNADTLRALLALASANEAADEERALVARLEAETLAQLQAHERAPPQQHQNDDSDEHAVNDNTALDSARQAILTSLESALTREGQTALDATASLAVELGIALPTPAALGAELLSLSSRTAALEQAIARIQTLTAYIARESDLTAALAAELAPPPPPPLPHHDREQDPDQHTASPSDKHKPGIPAFKPSSGYHPPADLSLQNLSTQRRIKSLASRIPSLRDKAAALSHSSPFGGSSSSVLPPSPTIEQVRHEEEAYLSLLAEKKALDAQVRAFAGLPPDTEQARQALDALRAELRRLTRRRDDVFEGLVERETPRKAPGKKSND